MALRDLFLPAWLVYLEEIAGLGYFAQNAPERCPDGLPHGWDEVAVRRALTKVLGRPVWPLNPDGEYGDDLVIRHIQAVYEIISLPTNPEWHGFCGNHHATQYEAATARYRYTVWVNDAFRRFATGYHISGGVVSGTASTVLQPSIQDQLPTGGDDQLSLLLAKAITEFRTANPTSKWTAVQTIVDAFEYVKTMNGPKNKGEAAANLIRRIAPSDEAAQHIDGLFRSMYRASNEYGIRHHNISQQYVHDDEATLEFFFYLYFNVIRHTLLTLYSGQSDLNSPTR